ncbi:MAG: hypothetical protein II295_01105 [Akkermansia sp.]|nr:hypothetical protein [Akkermansia sp.]
MKKQKNHVMHRAVVSLMGGAALLGLSACDEGTPATPTAPAATEQAAEAPQPVAGSSAADALLEGLIYDLGKQASEVASHPELTESVRNMLALLEEYYTQSAEQLSGKPEKVRLALRLADTARDLTAWERACNSYDRARADYDALPDAERSKSEVRRYLSAINNGKGFCMMQQRKFNEALELYTKALEVDAALYELVAPPEGEALPEGDVEPELARAAEDYFFSYRCLGECQELAGDPEEARETLKSGIELAKRLNRLNPTMNLQYIRLLGALGNLEIRCGNEREALQKWAEAASMCQRLFNATTNLSVRYKTQRQLQNLVPNIKALQEKLQPAEQPAEQPAAPAPQA